MLTVFGDPFSFSYPSEVLFSGPPIDADVFPRTRTKHLWCQSQRRRAFQARVENVASSENTPIKTQGRTTTRSMALGLLHVIEGNEHDHLRKEMRRTMNAIKNPDKQCRMSEREFEQWDRVYAAITVRWPSISLGEAKTINRNVAELVNFVADNVDTDIAEIESVVSEFAPETPSALLLGFRAILPVMLGFGIGYLATAMCFRPQSHCRAIARRPPARYFS